MMRFETRIWDVPFLPAESRLTLGTEYRWDDERGSQVDGAARRAHSVGGSLIGRPRSRRSSAA